MTAETRHAHIATLTTLRELVNAEDRAVDLKLALTFLIDAVLVILKDSN